MDFKTSKSIKLLEGVRIDGEDIYLNLATGNAMKAAGFAQTVDLENPTEIDKLASMIFTEDSYKLVSMLDIEDFVSVLDVAMKAIEKEQETAERFRRE